MQIDGKSQREDIVFGQVPMDRAKGAASAGEGHGRKETPQPLKVREASKGFSPTQKDTHCKHGRKTAEEKKNLRCAHCAPQAWWTIRDSNPGPTGYEPAALTN